MTHTNCAIRMTWRKYRGYWWPGAYLAPGHLQPSCWRKPIPKFQVLNGMSHIHHQGISAMVADGLELSRHQYICQHHVDVGRYPVRVLYSVIIPDESAWLLLMAWYLFGRPLGCPYFIYFSFIFITAIWQLIQWGQHKLGLKSRNRFNVTLL